MTAQTSDGTHTAMDDAVAGFWSWWSEARTRIEAALESGAWGPLPGEIAAHVDAIDDRLHWELAPGHGARHAFVVSGNGDLEARRIAERWRSKAPADPLFEFHAARPPRPGSAIRLGDVALRAEDARFAIECDDLRLRLDVVVHHPSFAKMSEDARETATVYLLDGALGEDDVSRWVGGIEIAGKAPRDGITVDVLRQRVESLRSAARTEAFVTLEGADAAGNPSRLRFDRGLRPQDHLACVVHVAVSMPLRRPSSEGLATVDEEAALEDFERILATALTGRPHAWLGHLTERAQRTWHFYVDGDESADLVAQIARAHGADSRAQLDPAWEVHSAIL